jgi:hypothetical protein
MAKRARRFDPNKSSKGGSSGTVASDNFFERHRAIVIGAIVVAVIGLVGFVVLQSATATAYTCDSLLTAPASETGAETDPDGQLGFAVDDIGRVHAEGSISYVTCPPTSGDHRAGGALTRRFYGAGSIQVPNDWVHNLEHGYSVIAYSGDPGAEVLGQIREAMDAPAPTEVATACGLPNKVIALRFDEMSEPFAVLAWDKALLLGEFDADLVTRAAEQFQDQPQAPEQAC